jgi:2'-5' RNA ligase
MLRSPAVFVGLGVALLLGLPGNAARGRSDEPSKVIAINVALDPDDMMLERAKAANERLRNAFRKGYSLDESRRPHVTCLQCFVKTADLDKLYAALDKVMAVEKPSALKMKATKYYYLPAGDMGLAGIVIEPTEDIVRFQKKVIDAVGPFTAETGDKAAFFTTKEDPDLEPSLIDYVKGYVSKASGKGFNPHVTIGLAKRDYLDAMLMEKFEGFTFSPAGLSVYQLGNYGTARKQLKGWKSKT